MRCLRLALCLFLVLGLFGCSSLSVEDLLSAPSLSDDQAHILEALNSESDGEIMLRYPRFGSSRAPIQFADLDADGDDEAIALYSSSEGNSYPGLAVLAKDSDGVWNLMSEVPGAGNEVYALNFINLEGSDGTFILAEWSTASSGRRISIYSYIDGNINVGFEDSCVRIIVDDMDSDGSMEFCYITDQSSTDSYKIKYIDSAEDVLELKSEHSLTVDTLSVMSVSFGSLSDGTTAVYVDEDLGDNLYTTEIFYIDSDGLHHLESAGGYNISELLTRSIKLSSDTTILQDGVVAVPSEVPSGVSTPFPESWTYWYSVSRDHVECVSAAYVNAEYLFAFSVPEEWFEKVLVTHQEDTAGRFVVTDVTTGETLFQLHVLSIGEDDAGLMEEGFWKSSVSGSYRYYMLHNCSREDKAYIENNFRSI